MKRIILSTTVLALMAIIVSSCVPQRKYQDTFDRERAAQEEVKSLTTENERLKVQSEEALSKYEVSERKIQALQSDTAVLGTSLRILRKQYDKINHLNDELLAKTTSLRQGTEEDKRKLMSELEELKVTLLAKEDALTKLEAALNAKEKEILAREAKLDEMRNALSAKDSMMTALRRSVSNALMGFEGKGLSVEYKQGRVYVSMDAKLLFDKGSAEVDKKGREVITDLAKALEGRDDLQVMVEGHTDSDEFNRATFPRNNWDLSVLRATSVVSHMLASSAMDPIYITAAGRSQYLPVDESDKAKNRRIEVIITPNLDDLMNMVGGDMGE